MQIGLYHLHMLRHWARHNRVSGSGGVSACSAHRSCHAVVPHGVHPLAPAATPQRRPRPRCCPSTGRSGMTGGAAPTWRSGCGGTSSRWSGSTTRTKSAGEFLLMQAVLLPLRLMKGCGTAAW